MEFIKYFRERILIYIIFNTLAFNYMYLIHEYIHKLTYIIFKM